MTLLPKKGDSTDIRNWRPLTLLCSDYKLLSKVLTSRLRQVLDRVIHKTQTYCVPGSSLVLETGLVSFDQEKAFDRVEHRYLRKVMERFGFSPGFIVKMKVMYENVESVLKINGGLCKPFSVTRGIRQGCSMYGMLYARSIEPMLHIVLTFITGIILPGFNTRFTVLAYADNIVVFTQNRQDVDTARVNWAKSEALAVGRWTGGLPQLPTGFRRSFRLWQRTSSRKRRQSCTSCLPSSGALSTPYEEVALYQRPPQENHRLIILVGAAKVGVNELRKRLIKLNPLTFQGPVPHTSRPIRAGEQMGREYHFVTKELFEYMVCNHRFVEFGEYKGHLYGTSTDAIEEVLKRGRVCIIDVEPHKLKPYVIFIKAPSPDRLRQTRREARILTNCTINRAFTEEDFVELEEASQLMEATYKQLFDGLLVNDDLQDACMQLCSIIQAAQDEPQWIPVGWSQTDE
ncbi:hypothetical protein FQN60_018761 [Etheostoma spectabile]|uniref:Guanylate kinase-like domain-containing protein n=1 Tax=Etheostoma spectabile TaxID=54343 RepID=A0A5J5CCJ1_9PERO|nr:hypothetical protein FQN60_018761 [Etheostoma spectabile]